RTGFTLLHLAEQAANLDGSGTSSQHIGNPSHDTGTLAQVCPGQGMRTEDEQFVLPVPEKAIPSRKKAATHRLNSGSSEVLTLPLMARVLGWDPEKRNTSMTQSLTDTSYVFGHSEEEIQRLVRQSRLFNPCTRRFLDQAGISAGMKVLDVGSGPGEVAQLVAERVGPGGAVVGVEIDPATPDIARARVRVAGYENVSFVVGDINRVDLDDDFDAIVGRLILIHLREPAATLRTLVRHLRPGGLVAFQDADFTPPAVSMPPSRLIEQLDAWIKAAFRYAGLEMQMGLKLYHLFLEAGLPAPCMCSEAAVFGTRESNQAEIELVIAYIMNIVRLLLPLILKSGIAMAEEVTIETLAERLRAEWTTQQMVWRIGADVVSAWT